MSALRRGPRAGHRDRRGQPRRQASGVGASSRRSPMSLQRLWRRLQHTAGRMRDRADTRLAVLWYRAPAAASQAEAMQLFRWLTREERAAGASLETMLTRLPPGM